MIPFSSSLMFSLVGRGGVSSAVGNLGFGLVGG
jgi:hypothetical protein